jgi:hypothetical protein
MVWTEVVMGEGTCGEVGVLAQCEFLELGCEGYGSAFVICHLSFVSCHLSVGDEEVFKGRRAKVAGGIETVVHMQIADQSSGVQGSEGGGQALCR